MALAGQDFFVFGNNFGHDRITDFDAGLDRIDLSQFTNASSFADLTFSFGGENTVVGFTGPGFGGPMITLLGIDPDELSASDFLF